MCFLYILYGLDIPNGILVSNSLPGGIQNENEALESGRAIVGKVPRSGAFVDLIR